VHFVIRDHASESQQEPSEYQTLVVRGKAKPRRTWDLATEKQPAWAVAFSFWHLAFGRVRVSLLAERAGLQASVQESSQLKRHKWPAKACARLWVTRLQRFRWLLSQRSFRDGL